MTRSAVASKSRFQSTLPARGATAIACLRLRPRLPFQSTLPARGATERRPRGGTIIVISIHAPRTGSDCEARTTSISGCYFNPRSPHGERLRPNRYPRAPLYFNPRSPHGERPNASQGYVTTLLFQSTLPARGATQAQLFRLRLQVHFNPRSPHGERPDLRRGGGAAPGISIHAPRTGSDADCQRPDAYHPISIHAPRTGSDPLFVLVIKSDVHFNPRSPHGERQLPPAQNHLSAAISIHAPRTGSDHINEVERPRIGGFQSTLPARGATCNNPRSAPGKLISIHAPRTGSDSQ